jgi:hypothetical protein
MRIRTVVWVYSSRETVRASMDASPQEEKIPRGFCSLSTSPSLRTLTEDRKFLPLCTVWQLVEGGFLPVDTTNKEYHTVLIHLNKYYKSGKVKKIRTVCVWFEFLTCAGEAPIGSSSYHKKLRTSEQSKLSSSLNT